MEPQSIQNSPSIPSRNDYLERNLAANLECNVAASQEGGGKEGRQRKKFFVSLKSDFYFIKLQINIIACTRSRYMPI